MSVTDAILVVFIALLLAYAIFDEFIMNMMKGKTRLQIHLKRKSRLDCAIFVGLIGILIYNNVMAHGAALTTYLLLGLALIAVYISYIRWPKLLLKNTGFFYANTFIEYHRIKSMNLSEDGILVIQLEQRRLLIQVKQLDDLERIYNFFLENQS
ncbi:DUF986 family protein [Yersinia aldovae]|uniref:DUF986 family protein n=1 Tax=Yersinia aldovae TaxID=29483 RepID=UPI0005ACC703|nr:DUF986 family protein [Yersinia aldovae]AJJ64232.1 hypothetical protein AT01_811 [Yersinia aldovae 670-83]